ncbi:MAG TPA: alkaline phosphatase family protein [Pirellulales bacterium]|nr:alkaline phosphatase family protein [Pirellulales bacterium]
MATLARPGQLRRWLRRGALTAVIVVAALVWLGREFPGWFAGRKSSAELLADIFHAPVEITDDNVRAALRSVNKQAVILFIQSCNLDADVEGRLCRLVASDHVDRVAAPFVYHLYELYGAPVTTDKNELTGLGYDESADLPPADGPGLAMLVRQSPRIRRHVINALRLFDALFLRVKPGAENEPLHWRYDEAAYRDIKAIFREVAGEMLGRSDDALARPDVEKSEYVAALEEILRDDERLSDFVEFFADFIRDLADNWLQSFVARAERQRRRSEWVERSIARGRNYAIADYAQSQLDRRLAVHIAVDGLQGKLLEGLAQLSGEEPDGAGARYVQSLVERHRQPEMSPAAYDEGERAPLPPLGADLIELAENPAKRPDFLENFKREVFAPTAQAVIVNVATVDTPTISVRNLPIIYSGHGVAGPFGTGIPNFSYLDRRSGRGWYFWGSDVLDFRRIFANREQEIPHSQPRPDSHGARTLFERLWRRNTMSAMPSVDTGALEKISAEVGTAVGEVQRNFIEKAIVLRLRRRAKVEADLNDRRRWLVEHRNVNDSFLGELIFRPLTLKTFREHARYVAEHEDEGLPDYLLWYNPWPDHFAHGKGPYSDAIVGRKGEYDRLDWFFGQVIEQYRPYLDRTLVGVVSDHGLIYTPRLVSTEKLLFDAMRSDGVKIKVQKLTQDEGGLPAIHGRDRLKPTRPYDAVIGSTAGGSYVIDLFELAGLQGDDEAWQRHPDYHQLRKHRLLSGQTIDFVEQLQVRLRGVMDVALVREYGPAPGEKWPADVESVVRVVTSDRGEARITRLRNVGLTDESEHRYRYELLAEQDPLALVDSIREELIPADGPSQQEIGDRLRKCLQATDGCSDRQWQEALSFTSRPDVIHQFSHLYDCDRAGTVNVFPLPHVGFNSSVPGRHAGETFGEKNGTQLYFGAGLKRARLQTARHGSLPVTLYHWLAGDETLRSPEAGFGISPARQFGYPTLLNEPAFAPLVEKRR